MRRLVKQLVGASVFAGGIWLCYDSWLRRASDYAVTVADIAVMRSPIAGVVEHELHAGRSVETDAAFATIVNHWIDDSYLRALEARAGALANGNEAFSRHDASLEEAKSAMAAQAKRRAALQREQVDALIEESAAVQQGAIGARLVAEQRRLRVQSMTQLGVSSHDALESAQLTELSAASQEAAQEHVIESLRVARTAATSGISVSNSLVGDTNYAEQRKDDIAMQLLAVRRDQALYRTEQQDVVARLDAERARVERLRRAALKVAARTRVWRVAATSGEYVYAGQAVAELVRCDSVRVLAQVSEQTYASLSLGARARLELTNDRTSYEGSVEQLLGPWQAGRELGALRLPDAKATTFPNRYAVLVSFPALSKSRASDCSIGKPGRVDFGGSWL